MKKFLNTLEDSVCLLDRNKELIYLNKAALESLGYSKERINQEVLEKSIEDLGDEVYLHIKDSEGKERKGLISISEVNIEEKCWLGKIDWQHQLSQKKKAELLESFLENLNQTVCIKDSEGNYMYANKHYRERIHASEEEILGTRDDDYWEEQYSTLFKESDDYTLKTNRECVIEEKGEDEKYFETTKFPIISDEIYIGTIIKEITLQKILHNQLVGIESEKDGNEILQGTINRLKEYFGSEQVNIWRYNEEKECVIF